MTELNDGTILQDGLRTFHRSPGNPENSFFIPFPVSAVVTKVYYNDDQQNRDGETIVCDVYCQTLGTDIYKVPVLLQKASVDNYIYYGINPHTANVNLSPSDDRRINPEVSNGDSVMVQFLNGSFHTPYITAILPHNQSGYKADDSQACPSPRPGSDFGDGLKIRFNGTNLIIDKNGDVSWESTPTVNTDTPAYKKWNLVWQVTDPLTQQPEDQKVEVLYDNASGNPRILLSVTDSTLKVSSIEISKDGIKLQTDTELNLQIDGNVTIQATGDATVEASNVTVEASGDAIVKGQTATVEATGDATVKGQNVSVEATQNVSITGTAEIGLNKSAGGQVLTTLTDPVVDTITGIPTVGVPTVLAG